MIMIRTRDWCAILGAPIGVSKGIAGSRMITLWIPVLVEISGRCTLSLRSRMKMTIKVAAGMTMDAATEMTMDTAVEMTTKFDGD